VSQPNYRQKAQPTERHWRTEKEQTMSDPLKDKRVKDCPDCVVVFMCGEHFTFYCPKHIRFGELPAPAEREQDAREADAGSRFIISGGEVLEVR
jgi:hypothetical protein